MEYVKDIDDYQSDLDSCVTLGKFDGLHIGHRELLKKVEYYSSDEGLKSIVFAFNMQKENKSKGLFSKALMTPAERMLMLEGKVDCLIEQEFSDKIRTMKAEDFISTVLHRKLHAKRIIIGRDFRFGYKALGDYKMLEELQDKYGYRVDVVEKIKYKDREISSTLIRETVKAGNVEEAAMLLGKNFSLTGTVESGRKLGRTLQFPTMNIKVPVDKLTPPNGVYAAKGIIDEVSYDGILNIGVKPTVCNDNVLLAELNLFDYEGDAYGKTLTIIFVKFIRKEIKFSSIEELKNQVEIDKKKVKEVFLCG